jgi:hypothetical protein
LRDSLLEYYSEEEILKNQMNWFNNNEYKESAFITNNITSEYDDIGVMYKSDDEKFIVEGILGTIFYKNNIKECYTKKDEIIEHLSSLLKDVEWKDTEYEDEEGIYTNTYTELKSGENIVVSCYDWSNKTEKEKNWVDHLRVSINTKEYSYWINYIEN